MQDETKLGKIPRLYINTECENEECLLLVYRALSASVCLLINSKWCSFTFVCYALGLNRMKGDLSVHPVYLSNCLCGVKFVCIFWSSIMMILSIFEFETQSISIMWILHLCDHHSHHERLRCYRVLLCSPFSIFSNSLWYFHVWFRNLYIISMICDGGGGGKVIEY